LSIAQPALQIYTDQQGLPQNSIRALVRDQQGRLWAATQDGAAYFDGRLWTPVAVPRALGSNFVTALAVTGESVWLGTPNGLCRYDALAHPSQPWRTFSLGSERANNITALLAIPDDRAGGCGLARMTACFASGMSGGSARQRPCRSRAVWCSA
jgi:Predicted periplasmic ligand-binding sensor domain